MVLTPRLEEHRWIGTNSLWKKTTLRPLDRCCAKRAPPRPACRRRRGNRHSLPVGISGKKSPGGGLVGDQRLSTGSLKPNSISSRSKLDKDVILFSKLAFILVNNRRSHHLKQMLPKRRTFTGHLSTCRSSAREGHEGEHDV